MPEPVRAELWRIAASLRELARAYPPAGPGLVAAAALLTSAAEMVQDRAP